MTIATFFADFAAQSLQVAVVYALVLALDAIAARRGGVRLRSALWAAFFVKLALPIQVTSPVSVPRLLAPDSAAARFFAVPSSASEPTSLAWILFGVWFVGFVASATIAIARARRSVATWSTSARAAPIEASRVLEVLAARVRLRRAPRLFVRDHIIGAASVGLVAPVLVVPASAARTANSSALEHMLLHELGHVRRRDAWRALAWSFARCVYWFHPCVHLAASRAALIRELACDELAASIARDGAEGYRRTLLELARPLVDASPVLAGFGGSSSTIVARLDRLERPLRRSPRRFDALASSGFVIVCAFCVPLSTRVISIQPLPSVDDVQGCMRKRLLVMAELARRDSAEQSPTTD